MPFTVGLQRALDTFRSWFIVAHESMFSGSFLISNILNHFSDKCGSACQKK